MSKLLVRNLSLFLMLICLSCTREVSYQVSYDPIVLPSPIDNIIVADPIDTLDLSQFKKRKRAEIAFNQATQDYLIESITNEFASDPNYKQTSDTLYESDLATFLRPFDSGTIVLIPYLSITKSDGFTMSSDEENRNYSTYYATTTVSMYNQSKKVNEITLNDKVKVEGSDLVLLVDAFAKEDLNFSNDIEGMLRDLASEYRRRWYPRTETITKTAFIGKKFKGFDEYFNKGELDQATSLVSPYLDSKNLTLQMQASYNMHIICEAQRDVDCSNKWLTNYERCQRELREQNEQ